MKANHPSGFSWEPGDSLEPRDTKSRPPRRFDARDTRVTPAAARRDTPSDALREDSHEPQAAQLQEKAFEVAVGLFQAGGVGPVGRFGLGPGLGGLFFPSEEISRV